LHFALRSVRRGDTMSKIAAEYRVSLAALMRVNGMSGRDVKMLQDFLAGARDGHCSS
jgi:LysM repeat protein